jgi:cell wall-associated NlpC family hydrolase
MICDTPSLRLVGPTAFAADTPVRPLAASTPALGVPAFVGDATVWSAQARTGGAIPAIFDPPPRLLAAEALHRMIQTMETAGKLSTPHATMLRKIADNPRTTEQQRRFLTEGISHLGKEYNWGSTGPDEFDCSGLTLYVSKQVLGLDLPDTARQQFATIPLQVSRPKLQPGDLVYFGDKQITHVGIYLADNLMLEAGGEGQVSTPDGKVRIRTVRKDYVGARRVVSDSPLTPRHR